MILVPSLGVVISNGDFLWALSSPDSNEPSVCRVNSVIHPDRLIVTWWLNKNELATMGMVLFPASIPVEEYVFVQKCRLLEVSEVSYTSSAITADLVKDISFVFHIDTLHEELPNCAGMSRVFFTRFKYYAANSMASVLRQNHCPFSSYVADSFPSRIWHSLLDIKQTVEKQLNDTKQYQACKKMIVLKCSLEVWQYILRHMVNTGAVLAQFQRNFTRKQLNCDLSLSSHRSKQFLTLLRIDTIASLSTARDLFGLTFGIGVRNRAPCKGEAPVTLHYGDVVNLVDVSANFHDNVFHVAPNRLTEFTSDQGIDFIFEQLTQTMKIRVRYCSKDAHLPVVLSSLRLNVQDLPRTFNNSNDDIINIWAQHVKPGICFSLLSGDIVQVISVVDDNVIVVPDDSEIQQCLTLREAAELLQSYIG